MYFPCQSQHIIQPWSEKHIIAEEKILSSKKKHVCPGELRQIKVDADFDVFHLISVFIFALPHNENHLK